MAGTERLENVNPTIHAVVGGREAIAEDEDDDIADVIDDREVFDILCLGWLLELHLMGPNSSTASSQC